MNARSARNMLAMLALTAGAGVSPLVAHQATSSQDDTGPLNLEKLVVTGSYIPYSVDAPAVPVRVVTAQEIEATGQRADLLEVIRKTVPQFVGNGNLGSANSNISGGSTNGG